MTTMNSPFFYAILLVTVLGANAGRANAIRSDADTKA